MTIFDALLVAVCALAASGAVVAAVAQEPPTAEAVLDCHNRHETGKPRRTLVEPGDLQIGPVAFRALGRKIRSLADDRFGRIYIVKSPILVRAGAPVVVAIASHAQSRASLLLPGPYPRQVSGGGNAIRFEPCPRNQQAISHAGTIGVATELAAGFVIARPSCVPVEVWVDGRSAPVRRTLPFGRVRC